MHVIFARKKKSAMLSKKEAASKKLSHLKAASPSHPAEEEDEGEEEEVVRIPEREEDEESAVTETAPRGVSLVISTMDVFRVDQNTGMSKHNLEDQALVTSTTSLITQASADPFDYHAIPDKDYSNKLAELKNENFNLKLRIYLLEERFASPPSTTVRDERNATTLESELTEMRVELEEKQKLLRQAMRAIELEEEEHRKELEEKCRFAELCRNEIDHLKAINGDLERRLAKEKENYTILENGVQMMKCCEDRADALKEEAAEKDQEIAKLRRELEESAGKIAACNSRIKELEEESEKKTGGMKDVGEELKQLAVKVGILSSRNGEYINF